MDFEFIYVVLFWLLVPILVVSGVVWLIIRVVRSHQGKDDHPLTLEQVKLASLGTAIAVLIPLFLNFLLTSMLPSGNLSGDTAGFQLGLGLALGLGVFILGLLARRVPLVGNAVTVGGFLFILYIVGVHFPSFEPIVQLLVSLFGLLLTIFFGYWLKFADGRAGRTQPTLAGIKSFGYGFLTFFFANLVIVYTNLAFNPSPGYSIYDGQSYESYETRTFVIVLSLSIAFLFLGLMIKGVRAVSGGLVMAGIISVIYAIFLSFSAVGQLAAALTSGLALVLLLVFAYLKFGAPPVQK